jgi:CubicO group peptidase (beta-lactamase class C family)
MLLEPDPGRVRLPGSAGQCIGWGAGTVVARRVLRPSGPVTRWRLGPRRLLEFVVACGGVVLLAGAVAVPGVSAAPPATPRVTPRALDLGSLTDRLDRELPGWLSRSQVPGAAVALVRDGQVAWTGGYGQADPARRVPVTPETVFQVGSISKSVTAWGVLRLVDKGLLDLDAPVQRYLTRWHLPASSFDPDEITVRRLLNHSAGLSRHGYPGLPPDVPLLSLEESLAALRIIAKPGAGYLYSGGGYTVLQLVIEEITGEAFATYMRREVLDPLGMTHSGFTWRDDLGPAAIGHNGWGRPQPTLLFTEKAAAGLFTTAADLARFAAATMPGAQGQPPGRGVLTPATVAEMLTPVALAEKVLAADATKAPPQITMGLGYFIDVYPDGTEEAWHAGGIAAGWGAVFASLPERGEGIVILTNSGHGHLPIEPALNAWSEWLRPAPTQAPQPPRSGLPTLAKTGLALTALLCLTAVLYAAHLLRRRRANQRPQAPPPLPPAPLNASPEPVNSS